jgi:hypothetical protein
VLQPSYVFSRFAEDNAPEVHYEIISHEYNMCYYLDDGIYHKWSILVKTIYEPIEEKNKMFVK